MAARERAEARQKRLLALAEGAGIDRRDVLRPAVEALAETPVAIAETMEEGAAAVRREAQSLRGELQEGLRRLRIDTYNALSAFLRTTRVTNQQLGATASALAREAQADRRRAEEVEGAVRAEVAQLRAQVAEHATRWRAEAEIIRAALLKLVRAEMRAAKMATARARVLRAVGILLGAVLACAAGVFAGELLAARRQVQGVEEQLARLERAVRTAEALNLAAARQPAGKVGSRQASEVAVGERARD